MATLYLNEILSSADIADIDRLSAILDRGARGECDHRLVAEAIASVCENRMLQYTKRNGRWEKLEPSAWN